MRGEAVAILGGGPAGLAAAWALGRVGIPFQLFEARDRLGGNCATLRAGDFRFDAGAHRFHDKDAEVTALVRELLGDELAEVRAPSAIHERGRLIRFPLAPLDLLGHLGPRSFLRAALSLARERLRGGPADTSFEAHALHAYGREIADRYLLGYSEKLWGAPTRELSPAIAGTRLAGLGLGRFLRALVGSSARRPTDFEEGTFLYPRGGYGAIGAALAATCPAGSLRTRSPVAALRHDGARITAFEAAGAWHGAGEVASSLPLGLLLERLDPPPPAALVARARSIRHRQVCLVALFLDRESVTPNATLYFPDPRLPFTRVSEPRNRSRALAPAGKTSLVAELACDHDDPIWTASDDELTGRVSDALVGLGYFEKGELLGSAVHRMANAYPVLTLESEQNVASVLAWLARFQNLHPIGRNGLHAYTHMHDQIRGGLELARRLAAHAGAAAAAPRVGRA